MIKDQRSDHYWNSAWRKKVSDKMDNMETLWFFLYKNQSDKKQQT